MATWVWWMQLWPLLLSLALGVGLGWLWAQGRPPPPPAVNPWEQRACREWDGERWI